MNKDEEFKRIAELYAEIDILDIKIALMKEEIKGRISQGSCYDVHKRELIKNHEERQKRRKELMERLKDGGLVYI